MRCPVQIASKDFPFKDAPFRTHPRQNSVIVRSSGKAGVGLTLERECKTVIEATGPVGSQILMGNLPR